ncbi:hypothetical protein NDU88_002883 [Pleurodeles waltl]|uniref:Uncharacterized protein n=1 Tax=Pleurodeles waltl TaxID=8319 RepID=A0AAV7KUZ5_PLEWA|nr:hypothetical protein NDU88_002883 [Pleurodeles waltl]
MWHLDDAMISAYPDYTMEVQRKRGSYLKVKQRLHDLQVKYALLFPVKLKIMDLEKTHIFQSPEEGLAATLGEEKEIDTWVTPIPRRCRRKPPRSRPDRNQAAPEQA